MYKSYTCKVKNADPGQVSEALRLAENEVRERPHPVS
jgi:hypothetical protein